MRHAPANPVNRHEKSFRVDTGANQVLDKPRPDWLAWSLQLIFGLVFGLGASFPVARNLYRSDFISFDQMFLAMAGGAFCCGAFASYYGWLARGRVILGKGRIFRTFSGYHPWFSAFSRPSDWRWFLEVWDTRPRRDASFFLDIRVRHGTWSSLLIVWQMKSKTA
jgi:hypothetical protein